MRQTNPVLRRTAAKRGRPDISEPFQRSHPAIASGDWTEAFRPPR